MLTHSCLHPQEEMAQRDSSLTPIHHVCLAYSGVNAGPYLNGWLLLFISGTRASVASAGCGTSLQTSATHAHNAHIALARRVVHDIDALISVLIVGSICFRCCRLLARSWPHDIAAGRFEPSRLRLARFFRRFVALTVWPCPIFAYKEAQKKP